MLNEQVEKNEKEIVSKMEKLKKLEQTRESAVNDKKAEILKHVHIVK